MSDHAFRELLGHRASIEGSNFDNCTAERAATLAMSLFGEEGPLAVAYCGLAARVDGRDCAYRFWFQVFQNMVGDPLGPDEALIAATTRSGTRSVVAGFQRIAPRAHGADDIDAKSLQ